MRFARPGLSLCLEIWMGSVARMPAPSILSGLSAFDLLIVDRDGYALQDDALNIV